MRLTDACYYVARLREQLAREGTREDRVCPICRDRSVTLSFGTWIGLICHLEKHSLEEVAVDMVERFGPVVQP